MKPNQFFLFTISLSILSFFNTVYSEEKTKLLPGFNNESRAGMVLTTGNSKSQTIDLSQKNSYELNLNKLSLGANYLRTTSKGTESARRLGFSLRYDRTLNDQWSIFGSQALESDLYAGYRQRYNTDLGGKLFGIKEESNHLFFESGYRFQSENQTNGTKKESSFLRAYSEYEYKWNPLVSTKLWVEFLQSLKDGPDRFINSEISLKANLTNIFSVQLAYLLRHRNLLPTSVTHKTDTTLTAALLAQF